MTMSVAAITASVLIFVVCWYGSVLVPQRLAPPPLRNGSRISWVLLMARFAAGILLFQPRPDAAALLEQGLSQQNHVQVAITLLAGGWALYLMLTGRVRPAFLLSGPRYWIAALIVAYYVSGFWSSFPALTVYRAFELSVFFVLIAQIFSAVDFAASVRKLLFAVITLMLVFGLWLRPEEAGTGTGMLAALRHNQGGMLAALWICLIVHSLVRAGRPVHWAELGLAVSSFILFGSFASLLALVGGLLTLIAFLVRPALRPFALVVLALTMLVAVHLLFAGVRAAPGQWLVDLAIVFGKTEELLFTLSGRVPYWLAVWEVAGDHPFGLGFASAERFLGLDLDIPTIINNAHSGYVSAWLGVGWLGLSLCLAIFAAALRHTRTLPADWRAVYLAMLAVRAANNLTVSAVGSPFNPGFVVMMALTCLPAAHRVPVPARRRGADPASPDPLPRAESG
jgi:hypothetical protein